MHFVPGPACGSRSCRLPPASPNSRASSSGHLEGKRQRDLNCFLHLFRDWTMMINDCFLRLCKRPKLVLWVPAPPCMMCPREHFRKCVVFVRSDHVGMVGDYIGESLLSSVFLTIHQVEQKSWAYNCQAILNP